MCVQVRGCLEVETVRKMEMQKKKKKKGPKENGKSRKNEGEKYII